MLTKRIGSNYRVTYPPIEDYAIIGNSRTAALISRAGSLDWLCLPRFDGPSFFAALLDSKRGGRFQIQPEEDAEITRRYIEDTAVLETTFVTPSGSFRLVDLMPVRSETEKRNALWPDHTVIRLVEGISGEVPCIIHYEPRPNYGLITANLKIRGRLGIMLEHALGICNLRGDVPLELSRDRSSASARFPVRAGERYAFSLAFNAEEPAVLAPLGDEVERQIEQTIRWWNGWARRCTYDEPYRDIVIRSAITLKLLTFAPSGAPVAAPTTSLPEEIGGVRNWDYRYTWLRDASLTIRAFLDLDYTEEAEAFLSWILHATRLSEPEVQILYDVYGETRVPERELEHLEGYRGSRPVRIGNGAAHQLQLDTYGEVINAGYEYVRRGGRLTRPSRHRLGELGEWICEHWREPDEGIWEVRSGRRHHTYSKAMCWVGLDRLVRLHDEGHLEVPIDRFRAQMQEIRDAIEARGFNERLGSYVSTFDGESLDASLALLGISGYADPAGDRMCGTLDQLRKRLGTGALLYRYRGDDDGLSGGEGAFGICSFWGVELQHRSGDASGASANFEELLSYANDLGLYAEEIDPASGAALGNFPQAFTHIGLINAALSLTGALGRGSVEGGTRT